MNPPDFYSFDPQGGHHRRPATSTSGYGGSPYPQYPTGPSQGDNAFMGSQSGNGYPQPSTGSFQNVDTSSPYYSTPGGGYTSPPGQYNPYDKMGGPSYGPDGSSYPSQSTPNQGFGYGGSGPGILGAGFSQQLLNDPTVMNAAQAYGTQFAEQQKAKISQYISWHHLRYYFAVDNIYVGKKLGLLLFPFAHTDWSVRYNTDEEPVPPRLDVNAPDLYIPCMAIVTYVLIAGFVMGTQGRFSPEQLGRVTSNAVAWLAVENLLILLTKYIMNISHSLSFWHSVAYSSYKFVGMTASLLMFMVGGTSFYYATLLYSAGAVAFFLIRTVKGFVLDSNPTGYADGTKRKLYLLLFISLTQPFIMWWLTSAVTSFLPMPYGKGFEGFEDWKPAPPPNPNLSPPPRPGGPGGPL